MHYVNMNFIPNEYIQINTFKLRWGVNMTKNKKSRFSKNKKGVGVADVEFDRENGLEKISIKSQKNHNQ